MNHRTALSIGFAGVAAVVGAVAACSSSSGSGDDSTTTNDGGGVDSTAVDSGARDSGAIDSAPPTQGDCSTVGGSCDIVAQNCDSGMECDLLTESDGATFTACRPTEPSETIPEGYPCCPAQSNPCLPGLECTGQTLCADGGPQTGVCAARCCEGDDSVCGMTPQGVAGRCDVVVEGLDGGDLYWVCDYNPSCKPFGVQPCASGKECLVSDMAGTSTCVAIIDPPGIGEGLPCTNQNACQSGLMCLGSSESNATCYMLCLAPGHEPPFDAGGLADGPTTGGCNAGKTCNGAVVSTIFPPWLGICE